MAIDKAMMRQAAEAAKEAKAKFNSIPLTEDEAGEAALLTKRRTEAKFDSLATPDAILSLLDEIFQIQAKLDIYELEWTLAPPNTVLTPHNYKEIMGDD